jgi:aprataxin
MSSSKSSKSPPSKRFKLSHLINPHSNAPQSGTRSATKLTSNPRDGLLEYILNPTSFSLVSEVIYHNDSWVLIKDRYPKASVHFLLLPRDPEFYTQHPFHAFKDAKFLAAAREEVEKARKIAASELRRIHGPYSATEAPRIEAMEADDPPNELPEGRDWTKDVRVGVHAYPSMNHMHIHVFSADMYSPCVKHRKHYNSFNTPFLAEMDDFPLAEDDARWDPGREGYFVRDFVCWRCGRKFGNKFTQLKAHLDMEFQDWRAV